MKGSFQETRSSSIHDVVAEDAARRAVRTGRVRPRAPPRAAPRPRIGGARFEMMRQPLSRGDRQQRRQTAAQARIAARARIGAACAQAGHEGAFRQAFEHDGIRGSGTRKRDGGVDPVSGEAGAARDRLGHAPAAARAPRASSIERRFRHTASQAHIGFLDRPIPSELRRLALTHDVAVVEDVQARAETSSASATSVRRLARRASRVRRAPFTVSKTRLTIKGDKPTEGSSRASSVGRS